MGKTYKIVMIRCIINHMPYTNLIIILILIIKRHGESEWNQQNRFCGWFDANLSETGIKVM